MLSDEREIITTARTGDEMQRATRCREAPRGAKLLMYSDLCQRAKTKGALTTISEMLDKCPMNVILLQDPADMDSGHWISVSMNKPKKEIYFFSTYGRRPDVEKLDWFSKPMMRHSGQELNILNDGLKELQRGGWEIHYNNKPYQKEGDNTATCGIYTAAFLRSGKNPDEFAEQTQEIEDEGENPAVVYYKRYFC